MNTNQGASAIRYEQERLNLVEKMAVQFPDYQPEMIARHYTKMAMIALELLKLCEQRRFVESSPDLEQAINYFTDQIRRQHLEDFAIPLAWKTNPSEEKL